MLVPYDPWCEEAKQWRHWAVKNGHTPTWWFGGIAHYTPMPIDEWKSKTLTWVGNTVNALEAEESTMNEDDELLTSINIGPHAALKAGESGAYAEIYQNLRKINSKRTHDLLEGSLKDVTEVNKAERIDAILDGTGSVHLNEEYQKPNIQLGTHLMESDEEFEMVWANFEPWTELAEETDFDIRLMPRWRAAEELVDMMGKSL